MSNGLVTGNGTSSQSKVKWLPCPICEGNPERYKSVKKACTLGQKFEKVARVNEHIRRYHSRKAWCMLCQKNFPTIKQQEGSEEVGPHTCEPKEKSDEDKQSVHTYLTIEQQKQWEAGNWKKKPRRDAKSGDVSLEHYEKLWKVFNPGQPVPNLAPSDDDIECSPNSSSSRSSTSGDSIAPGIGTKRKATHESIQSTSNFPQQMWPTNYAQPYHTQCPHGPSHEVFNEQDQRQTMMWNLTFADMSVSLPSMTYSGGSETHESVGRSAEVPASETIPPADPNNMDLFMGLQHLSSQGLVFAEDESEDVIGLSQLRDIAMQHMPSDASNPPKPQSRNSNGFM